MAKTEKKYPDFECIEYDYGSLSHRQYSGTIHVTLKFVDDIHVYMYFPFKDFMDYHKRKKTDFHQKVEKLYKKMNGWGSRYFELIEIFQEDDDVDMFELFANYIEATCENLPQKYELVRLQTLPYTASQNSDTDNREKRREDENDSEEEEELEEEQGGEEENDEETSVINNEEEEKQTPPSVNEEEEDDFEETPYEKDRKKFRLILAQATNEMYDALKVNFFPQMEYFQRRYPSKWKSLMENIESLLLNFEEEMLHEMLPELDEDEYREFEIRYNSQKADMSDDEPPAAR